MKKKIELYSGVILFVLGLITGDSEMILVPITLVFFGIALVVLSGEIKRMNEEEEIERENL